MSTSSSGIVLVDCETVRRRSERDRRGRGRRGRAGRGRVEVERDLLGGDLLEAALAGGNAASSEQHAEHDRHADRQHRSEVAWSAPHGPTSVGSSTTKRAPPPAQSSTHARPPIAALCSATSARPRPVPTRLRAALPRANRSKIRPRSPWATPGPLSSTATPEAIRLDLEQFDPRRTVAVVVGVVEQVAEDALVAHLVDRRPPVRPGAPRRSARQRRCSERRSGRSVRRCRDVRR